ncbi:dihydrolipoyl dehydrogenase family protein [Maledivibacter halophilus]|uniref:Pyruvate/2-oxoglutarate dehydrogenase complex, dihydrolipoamide dehydrogenase (E3) component n=1 Tax=Maledivibacter halophilus TaxID=36842 RepID=A0A1T5LMV8_9FIRM|nr:NAD(P)/FAD-dependent oxidoreductase [Maledivibacter halophilus]SKC76879.1 Pyruvate/2-oxoglutarate dehydrogenase complex, dihydrolipoamide dehydrogenase (E3) component [Maledivibacter halophilus]
MKKYDIAIIGAGAGGLNAAFEALVLGKKVVLIEKNAPGGECTWSGCIPSKALINIADEIHTAKKYGAVNINGKEILNKVRTLIHEAHQAEAVEVLNQAGINYIKGYAKFKDSNTLDVDGKEIKADKIFICTGSSALVPPIKGLDWIDYLTNENIFLLDDLPKSMIVLGGGPIGVELAQAFNRLGVSVKIVEMAETILFREEKEMALEIQSILEKEGVEVFTSSKGIEVKEEIEGVNLIVDKDGKTNEIKAEKILLALGRKPNLKGFNLEKIGVRYNNKAIEVNECFETNIPNIYAVGDVVGPYLFSHMGAVQAKQAVRNAFTKTKEIVDYSNTSWCTFTHPEFARTGMKEEEARAKFGDNIQVFTHKYRDIDRAVVDQKSQGMAKIICDKEGYILGASILGERACEMLGELQIVKSFKIPFYRLHEAIHPYPSYSELLLTMSKNAYDNKK